MGTLLLFLLQLPLDILQTTALSDLTSTVRYVVLAITATVTVALSTYALAPPTTLQACDRMGVTVLQQLSQIEAGHGTGEDEPSAEREGSSERAESRVEVDDIRRRLSVLERRKERIAQVVWGHIQSHVARAIVSLPYLCTTLRLLYDYFSLSQDIEVLARKQARRSQRSAQNTPNEPPPDRQSAAASITVDAEEHEMHSLDGV